MELPSGCVVPGSCVSKHKLLASVLSIFEGGCLGVPFGKKVHLGGAPCQVGTRLVKLAGLSSKSDCNLCVAWRVQGAYLACAFLCPVCSISWLGSSWEVGPIPVGKLSQNWSDTN